MKTKNLLIICLLKALIFIPLESVFCQEVGGEDSGDLDFKTNKLLLTFYDDAIPTNLMSRKSLSVLAR